MVANLAHLKEFHAHMTQIGYLHGVPSRAAPCWANGKMPSISLASAANLSMFSIDALNFMKLPLKLRVFSAQEFWKHMRTIQNVLI